ncbi:hypothetical protein [Pseudomonas sp. HLT2-19-2]
MISNEDTDAFRELANSVHLEKSNFSDYDYHCRLLNQSDLLEHQVCDALFQLIRESIVATSGEDGINLRELERALLRQHLYLGSTFVYHTLVVWILFGVNEKKFRSLSEVSHWRIALRAVYCLMAIPGHTPSGIGNDRDIAVTQAAIRLRSQGYEIGIRGGEFFFEEGQLKLAYTNLDKSISTVGGAAIIFWIFWMFHHRKKFSNERYLAGREADSPHGEVRMPAYPHGYLLNMSVRHLRKKSHEKTFTPEINQIFELARDIVSIFDVEDYSMYANIFTDHEQLPKYIERLTLGDFCLSFRQVIARDVVKMMRELFTWVDSPKMRTKLGWDVTDAIRLAEATFTMVRPEAVNAIISHSDLAKQMGCSSKFVKNIADHFTHKTDSINHDFFSPTDSSKADFHNKPFIWQPGNKLLVISPPICSIGFFESLARVTRENERETDNKIGVAIEPMLGRIFADHGITPSALSSQYKVGKKTLDCDLAIECDNAVILFEIKKKPLTKAAMGGRSLEGLIDLSRSMIKSQTQLSYQEIELLENNGINFIDGRHIKLEGRKIERIAVTLFDWGSLQDRTVADNIIKTLFTAQISATQGTEAQKIALDECNKLLETLLSQTTEISKFKPDERQAFFDCLFLGVPQIIFLLKDTKNSDEFYENLKTIKHSCMSSMDMFNILTYTKK